MTPDLQPAFRALADPTRRDILRLLGDRDMTIAEVSDQFDMTRAAVKKHLVMLTDGGLITVRAEGRERINSLNAQALRPVMDWLGWFDRFWDTRLDALKSVIEQETPDD
ncbi:ArsR/SmtB family transcription factor [Shimia thalassica]|uniref:ArsR/SmtB family transcription factor n=1 Tax=Shimia thalassica TaxID=1715693 RepID=UPI002734633D|nr:metalloregulator ArsR/SmtB family transcription factor [Shimia thalassica]MDP2519357.1 metalloregulator ArsR/SmtB family transcription factor [Shimia thalassica]